MKTRKLVTLEEHTIGTEDRVFQARSETDPSGWYWQARGCADAYGPFASRAEAEADYNEYDAAVAEDEMD